MSAAPGNVRYEGRSAEELARLLDLPRVELFGAVSSTQDVAHTLGGQGAPGGTLVLADEQTAGRGRGARAWESAAGAGVWLTLLERPIDGGGVGVLSLRLALRLAPVLERWARPISVKWPNDLLVEGRKLAGILVEARWRGALPDWVAIGVGVNVRRPATVEGASLGKDADRLEVLGEMIPAMRAAAAARGVLTREELAQYERRDAVRDRQLAEPARGVAAGITPDGALIIRRADGDAVVRTGSLVLEDQR